jgi:hypothetical protein
MAIELLPITYTDTKGRQQETTVVRGRAMPRRLEQFCRFVASGELGTVDAYCKAYDKTITIENGQNIATSVSHMMARTDVILRIQQLRTPVIPKVAEKFEYSMNRALEQCQTAWDLAYAQGNVQAMLKAIEMQARLSKLLSEQIDVTHRYGFLDDTATENLLKMKQQLEAVQKQRKTIDVTPQED